MITLYKPNSNNKGSLLSCNVRALVKKDDDSQGEKAFYTTIIKQTGWDDKNKTGTFKDGEKVVSKFNAIELADIIYAFNSNQKVSFFHDGGNQKSQIIFAPRFKKEKKGNKWVDTNEQVGFGLAIYKSEEGQEDKELFVFTFSFGEAQYFIEYLKFSLEHIFSAMYSEAKLAAENFSNKGKGKSKGKGRGKASKKEEETIEEDLEDPESVDDDIPF